MALRPRSTDLLISLTYYRPHVSGLTLYNQRLAEGLAARGRGVTVLTSRYRKDLPREETVHGVRIVRVPIWARIGKGVLMPNLPWHAVRPLKASDVILMSLPNTPIEAIFVPLFGRLLGRKVVSIFHCDLCLPSGWFNRIAEILVRISSLPALLLSDRVVVYTDDYAESVGPLRWVRGKRTAILPPVAIRSPSQEEIERFQATHNPEGGPMLGFAGRIATEKGIEDILEAFEIVRGSIPTARLLLAGEWENVLGERACRRRIEPLIERQADRCRLLGVLSPDEMGAFYASCDVLLLPSRNRTESFGLVQVESMMCGSPVVASDLPGVRVPVQRTGMGLIVPPGNPAAIADAVTRILDDRPRFIRPRSEVERIFSIETTLDAFEKLVDDLASGQGRSHD